MKYICDDTGEGQSHINGFKRLQDKEKEFVVRATPIANGTDGVMAELLEDPRVALRSDELTGRLALGLKSVVDVSAHVWE